MIKPMRGSRLAVALLGGLLAQLLCQAQTITTYAGSDSPTLGDGGPALNGSLSEPTSVALDGLGNLYIADYMNNRIRKVDTNGIITTVAGNGTPDSSGDGGLAISAAIHLPWGVVVDSTGNIYFSERINSRVRRVNAAGIITTVAGTGTSGFSGDGGPATKAQIYNPFGLAVDGAGNLYIADTANQRIRMVKPDGTISTVAGNPLASSLGDGGLATAARLSSPTAVALDGAGNLYIAEGNRIRKVNGAGIIGTIAGNASAGATGDGGPATSATLQTPDGVVVDGAGNVFIGDSFNSRVRKVDTSGIITTIAGGGTALGNGGPAVNAKLGMPIGLALDCAGSLYIADSALNLIRKVAGVATASGPTICAVLNAASLLPGLSLNSWATIKGNGFASGPDTWDKAIVGGNLPTALDGISVTIGGKAAYIYYVSANQINLLVPDIGFGPQPVVVKTPSGSSAPFIAQSAQYGPAFFEWPNNQAVATRQDFSWAVKNGTFAGASTVAAKPGEVIILWGTGFGPTSPPAPVGMQVPGGQTYSTPPPTVTVNNVAATVYGAALAPGNAGLYQVAIQIPASLADGDGAVQTSIGGVQSPGSVILSIKH